MQNGLSYGIDREILVDEIEALLKDRNIENLDEELGENSLSFKDKANTLVRKLIDYGWVYKETLEYQGNIISIYHLLYSTENINSGVLLKQVFENTSVS